MTTLTKEQMDKLSLEQQETLAKIELQLLKKRQRLLANVQGKPRWVSFFASAVWFCYTGWLLIFVPEGKASMPWVVFAIFMLIVTSHMHTNRRIDALIELQELDGEKISSHKVAD